mmetsp:Transcript_9146/g.26559  ORF Transcript_9146/g.26559 Transcript_9146/m.26559 type:complete len:196 (+) Transcript_9146:105-692(+)
MLSRHLFFALAIFQCLVAVKSFRCGPAFSKSRLRGVDRVAVIPRAHTVALFGLFGSPEERAAREAEKERQWQEQQAILERRRQSGGKLTMEDEMEIYKRRAALVSDGERKLEKLQADTSGKDTLEAWKELRESGEIKTASSGLVRDPDSSRMGSEGLFAERVDTKLPFVENGYVDESADVMGKLGKMFGKKKRTE